MSNTDRWKPEEGKLYYYIDSLGNVQQHLWVGSVGYLFYEIGNYFRTEE